MDRHFILKVSQTISVNNCWFCWFHIVSMKYLLQIMSVEVCLTPPEGTMERSVNERVEGYCNGWLHVTETKNPQRRKTEKQKKKRWRVGDKWYRGGVSLDGAVRTKPLSRQTRVFFLFLFVCVFFVFCFCCCVLLLLRCDKTHDFCHDKSFVATNTCMWRHVGWAQWRWFILVVVVVVR